jgi:phosphoglycerate dehydrogenase-like enzyme
MHGVTDASRVVLITAPITPDWLERLRNLSPDVHIEHWPVGTLGQPPRERWRNVEILYTSFATQLPSPEDAPHLRWIQFYSAGIDSVLDHPLVQTAVSLTTASGVHAVTMAEFVFAVVLAWYHRLPRIIDWQQRRRWPGSAERLTLFSQEELAGKTIGIVGYGSVGRQVARLASAFGMRAVAIQHSAEHRDHGFQFTGVGDPAGTLPDRYFTPDELRTMLAESDVVIISAPLTRTTRGMFDEAAFRAMKPSAFLVNTARGELCDEAALVQALREQRIAGAALDVFHEEPLPPDHPLWTLPNAMISPHVSGLSSDYAERAAAVFAENLRRYVVSEPLCNLVNKVEGY